VTADGSNTAHFEHMVAITRNGPDVLTREWDKVRAGHWFRSKRRSRNRAGARGLKL